jgi:hypothetical protein
MPAASLGETQPAIYFFPKRGEGPCHVKILHEPTPHAGISPGGHSAMQLGTIGTSAPLVPTDCHDRANVLNAIAYGVPFVIYAADL